MTNYDIKGMRIAMLITMILMITFLVLHLRSYTRNQELEYELLLQKSLFESTTENQQSKIDSLIIELNRFNQDSLSLSPE